MSSTELAERAAKHTLLERGWNKEQMADDPLFAALANTRRESAHIGRIFVAWTISFGKPVIDTLFKVDRLGINNDGLNITLASASVVREIPLLRLRHTPLKLPGLDIYLWLPHFAEVRYAPFTHFGGAPQFRCSVPLLIRYQYPTHLSQAPGRLYFAPKSEFVALWPEHDF